MNRLSHVLHPEILLNRRGPELDRTMYKELLRQVYLSRQGWSIRLDGMATQKSTGAMTHQGEIKPGKIDERGWVWSPAWYSFSPELRGAADDITISACAIYKKFLSETQQIYHVQRDFLQALSGVDREIPIQFLPDRFFGFISFAPNTIRDDTGWVEGAYCYIGGIEETALTQRENTEKILWIVYTTQEGSTCSLQVELKPERLADLLKELPNLDGIVLPPTLSPGQRDALRSIVYRTVLNTALYIHSQQPNLRRESGSGNLELSKTKQKEVRQNQQIPNACTVPVTFVNWGFEKPLRYRVGETSVSGHFRWQPCGTGRSEIKLIWIDEHLRTYPVDPVPLTGFLP